MNFRMGLDWAGLDWTGLTRGGFEGRERYGEGPQRTCDKQVYSNAIFPRGQNYLLCGILAMARKERGGGLYVLCWQTVTRFREPAENMQPRGGPAECLQSALQT